jgi:hypothetical protein
LLRRDPGTHLREGSGDLLVQGCHVAGVPSHDGHEGPREHVPEQSNELLVLPRHEALPVLPESPAGHVVDVEELVGRAADFRVPLLARVEANPL